MFKNYLKIAFRNLWRRKGFSLLNITGLAIGMASAILILLWIGNEWSYDKFHKNGDRLYEVWNRDVINGTVDCWETTPRVLGPALLQEYAGFGQAARTDNRWFVTAAGEKKMSSHSLIVDPAFLSMFSFPLVQGNAATALNGNYSIVVTQEMAQKMFGTEEAMNRVIKIDNRNFTVTGILKDLPVNSSFDFEYLLPWNYQTLRPDELSWGNNSISTYVQLRDGVKEEDMDARIRDITRRHTKGAETTQIFLHPLAKWHLYSNFENGRITGGRIVTVRLFGIIAAFILLIACINFMNLSTARSERRAKEVGIRKVAGACRSLLIGQFLGESILIALISGLLALLLVQVSLPAFDTLVDKHLVLPYDNPYFWSLAFLFVVLTGIVAGIPGFFPLVVPARSYFPGDIQAGAYSRHAPQGAGCPPVQLCHPADHLHLHRRITDPVCTGTGDGL